MLRTSRRPSGPPRRSRRRVRRLSAGSATTNLIRPRRVDVVDCYDRGAYCYESLWSPVILPPAAALVPSVVRASDRVVVDVGAGTGALHGALHEAAPGARLVALDVSARMLHLARFRRGATSVLADALALPLADSSADVVILAYVLFHLADPAQAIAEAARVLRPGGRVATITWAWERGPGAGAVWEKVLTDANVPPAPLRSADAGLNRPSDVDAMLRSAGFRTERIRCEHLSHQWDPRSFWELVYDAGPNGVRIGQIDAAVQGDVLARVRAGLAQLAPADFLWEGEVICAVATKDTVISSAQVKGDAPGGPCRQDHALPGWASDDPTAELNWVRAGTTRILASRPAVPTRV